MRHCVLDQVFKESDSIMASLQLGAELSLCPPFGAHLEMKQALMDNDAVIMENNDSWMQLTQERAGNVSQLAGAGFMDNSRAPSDLETSSGTRIELEKCHSNHHNQLTLFYAGTVTVFENVTVEKAQLIMSLAGGDDSCRQVMDTIFFTESSMKGLHTPSMQPSFNGNPQVQGQMQKVQSYVQELPTGAANPLIGQKLHLSNGPTQNSSDFLVPYQAMVPKALPLARKESLARFLERRKERVRMMAPYTAKGSQVRGCCSKPTTQMLCNGLWASPSMYMFGGNAELAGVVAGAKKHDWTTNHENGKQVSETDGAT